MKTEVPNRTEPKYRMPRVTLPNLDMDVEVVPTVPDAQSAPNEAHISRAVGDKCQTYDVGAVVKHTDLILEGKEKEES